MRHQYLLSILIITLLVPLSHAGTLDNLEEAATTSKKKSSSKGNSSSQSSSGHSPVTDELAAGITEAIVKITFKMIEVGLTVMAEGGENSLQRYASKHSVSIPIEDGNAELAGDLYREIGDPILPTIRLSSQWLSGSDNVNAQLSRLEGGFGLIGFSHSVNHLTEQGDSLTLKNTLLHYRMSFGNNFSCDLAYGRGRMNGNQAHEGDVFAMPIRIRFNPKWHFEYYPIWSSYKRGSLSEHQFSLNWQYQHYGLTTGYKKWSAGPTTVDGVFAGLTLSY